MRYRLYFYCLVLTFLTWNSTPSSAGIQWAEIGVDGLTCSLCTRSVEMSLLRLDFVDRVEMDLETTAGKIYFKLNEDVNPYEIAKAIKNAGFSVRFLRYQLDFTDIPVDRDGNFALCGQKYQILDLTDGVQGQEQLRLVDEKFLPKNETTWKKAITLKATTTKDIIHVVAEN